MEREERMHARQVPALRQALIAVCVRRQHTFTFLQDREPPSCISTELDRWDFPLYNCAL